MLWLSYLIEKLQEALLIAMKRVTSDMRLRHPFFEIFSETWGNKGGSKVENEPTIRLLVAAEV